MKKNLILLTLLVTNAFATTSNQFTPEKLLNVKPVLISMQMLVIKTKNQQVDWEQLFNKKGIAKPTTQSFITTNLANPNDFNTQQSKLIFNAGVTTINGTTLPLEARRKITYVSSTSVTQNSKGTYQTIEPGIVKPGFDISITPLVDGKEITIDSKFSLTLLNSITNIKSGDQSVQLPNVSHCTMNQKATLKSGDTMVVSACDVNYETFFQKFTGESGIPGDNSLRNAKVVYLITPTIWNK